MHETGECGSIREALGNAGENPRACGSVLGAFGAGGHWRCHRVWGVEAAADRRILRKDGVLGLFKCDACLVCRSLKRRGGGSRVLHGGGGLLFPLAEQIT